MMRFIMTLQTLKAHVRLTICIHLVERFMVRQAGKILHKCGKVYALLILETDFGLSDSLTIYKVKHYGKWAVLSETLTMRTYW